MTTSSSEVGPLSAHVQRWHQHLIADCIEYRGLQQERERGWQSTALDRWYRQRQMTDKTTATAATPGDAAKPVVTSSFQDADIASLCERYRVHARRITSASPTLTRLFHPVPPNTTPPVSFVDLGCAPGGVSKYLTDDLRWRGVGLTLADVDGGITMDAGVLNCHARTVPIAVAAALAGGSGPAGVPAGGFLLLEGDVSQPASTWIAHSASHAAAAAPPTLLTAHEALRAMASGPPDRYDFINGGAVQDHGQRQARTLKPNADAARPQKRSRESDAEAVDDNMSGPDEHDTAGEDDGDDLGDSPCILPWFTLFVPQLQFALSHVKDGGAMMIVYGVPQCASCCLWLHALDVFLSPDSEETDKGDHDDHHTPHDNAHVHVLETMHLVKSPVYLLWDGLYVSQRQAAVTRILAAADPTSDVLCPMEPSSLRTEALRQLAAQEEQLLATLSPAERVRFKRRFWLGETELGFALASEGFARYGPLLAKSWERARAYLASRRARAEAAMRATDGATPASSGAATTAEAKPPRRGRGTFHA